MLDLSLCQHLISAIHIFVLFILDGKEFAEVIMAGFPSHRTLELIPRHLQTDMSQ